MSWMLQSPALIRITAVTASFTYMNFINCGNREAERTAKDNSKTIRKIISHGMCGLCPVRSLPAALKVPCKRLYTDGLHLPLAEFSKGIKHLQCKTQRKDHTGNRNAEIDPPLFPCFCFSAFCILIECLISFPLSVCNNSSPLCSGQLNYLFGCYFLKYCYFFSSFFLLYHVL